MGHNQLANPLFIFGYMHTGTSLLFNILASSQNISSYKKEINLIQRRQSLKDQYKLCTSTEDKFAFFKNLVQLDQELGCPSDFEFSNNHDLVADYFKFWKLVSSDKTYYLDGSPNNYLFDSLIMSKLDHPYKAIAIIRDPRDTIASKKKRWQTTNLSRYDKSQLFKKKTEKGYSIVWDSISIKKSYEKIKAIDPAKRLIIKYEDLVGNYDEILEQISSYLGLQQEEFVTPENITFSNKANHQDNSTGLYKNTANYNKTLTPSEVYAIQLICKKELEYYQFPLESVNFLDKLKASRYIFSFFSDLVVRLVKRIILFGPKEFLNYLAMSFRRFR